MGSICRTCCEDKRQACLRSNLSPVLKMDERVWKQNDEVRGPREKRAEEHMPFCSSMQGAWQAYAGEQAMTCDPPEFTVREALRQPLSPRLRDCVFRFAWGKVLEGT